MQTLLQAPFLMYEDFDALEMSTGQGQATWGDLSFIKEFLSRCSVGLKKISTFPQCKTL